MSPMKKRCAPPSLLDEAGIAVHILVNNAGIQLRKPLVVARAANELENYRARCQHVFAMGCSLVRVVG